MIPDLIEPIVAWRLWRIAGGGSLESVGLPLRWPEQEAVSAICPFGPYHASSHEAPVWSCSCGLYGVKRPEALAGALGSCGDLVLGLVSLWGRVIEAPHGYRAQFAAPRVLVAPADPLGLIADCADRHRIPARIGSGGIDAAALD